MIGRVGSGDLAIRRTTSFTYDHNGNTLTKTDSSGTTQYGWDYENRLTSVTLPNGGGMVSFTYDPFGRRIEKAGPSGTVIYAYDGANGIEELDASGNVTARYIQGAGIDEPLAQSAAALNFYEADGLGSITSMTDSTGTASEIYTYDAYGNLSGSAGQVANAYRYTGREYDQDTGLYYYRARYYDSQLGRFLNEDPIFFRGGGNFYRYVANSPIGWEDALGLKPCKSCGLKSFSGYDITGVHPKGATFHWHAEFLNDSEHDPKCCEVRQMVMWNRPPRQGRSSPAPFPPDFQPGEWYEDRDANGFRYGRRSGPYSDPNPDAWNSYKGNSYDGTDQPSGYIGSGFAETFRLVIVDVCNGDRVVAMSRKSVTINW